MIQNRDFDELYQLLKGSPFANLLVDAKTAFQQKDYAAACELVGSAQSLFEQRQSKKARRERERSQSRGKPSDRRAKVIAEKADKVQRTRDGIASLLADLKKLDSVPRPAPSQEGSAAGTNQDGASRFPFEQGLKPEAYTSAVSADEQLNLLQEHWRVVQAESSTDLVQGAVLHIRTKQGGFLVRCKSVPEDATIIELESVLDGKSLRPQKKQALLDESRKGRLVVIKKPVAPSEPSSEKDQPTNQDEDPTSEDVEKRTAADTSFDSILEMGAFTQLHDAAVRSGLVPGADLICHVRDREFRLQDFGKASQLIEGLYGKYCAASAQREQRLRREDVDIASGRIKISPKELQAKRARDTADTQKITRAHSRFRRVMEGLRVIILTEQRRRDEQARQAAS